MPYFMSAHFYIDRVFRNIGHVQQKGNRELLLTFDYLTSQSYPLANNFSTFPVGIYLNRSFCPNVSTRSDLMNSRYSNMFRFSFAIYDLLALNLVHFILLLILKNTLTVALYSVYFMVTNVVWIFSSYVTALYIGKHHRYERFLKRSIETLLLYYAFVLFFIFVSNNGFSRLFVLLSFTGFLLTTILSRTLILGATYFLEKKGQRSHKIVLIGNNSLSKKLVHNLSTFNKTISVEGYFDDSPVAHSVNGFPFLGRIENSISYAKEAGITEIYCIIPPEQNKVIYKLAMEAERHFIRFKYVPDFRMFIDRKVHVDFSRDIPILSLRPEPIEDFAGRTKKRTFDLIFSFFFIVFVLSWLTPLIALLIKLDSRGPVFFKQLRSGKNNRPFSCYKFRSLHVNNEADHKQVTRNDDRFTRVGRFLRKTNLDELPQFFNVFHGSMSIVGPRPHMLKHTEEYSGIVGPYMVRHFVKPGITGWAQIHGFRGEIKEQEQLKKRIDYDIWYMEHWSLWLDLRIVLLTAYTMMKGDKNAF